MANKRPIPRASAKPIPGDVDGEAQLDQASDEGRTLSPTEKIALLGQVCCSTAFMAVQLGRLGAEVRHVDGEQHIGETIAALASRLDLLANAGLAVIDGIVEDSIRKIKGAGPVFDETEEATHV